MIEEREPGLLILKFGDAFLGLSFREGVPFEDANRLVAEMRRMLDTLSYTKFHT